MQVNLEELGRLDPVSGLYVAAAPGEIHVPFQVPTSPINST